MARVPCPRCGEDDVAPVHLGCIGQDAFLCEECDALWLSAAEIVTGAPRDLWTYLEEKGVPFSVAAMESIRPR